MTFRLQLIHRGPTSVVKVDGTLIGEGRAELLQVVNTCGRPLQLDLTDLRSADEEALHVIRELQEGGTEIVGASHYIALRLEASSTGVGPLGGPPQSDGPDE